METFFELFYPIKHAYRDNSIDWFYTIITSLLDLILIAVILLLVLLIVFEVQHQRGITHGTVVSKNFETEHTTMSLMPVGKSLVPITSNHTDSYIVYIEDNGKSNYWNIDKDTYDCIKVGDKFDYNEYTNKMR